MGSFDKSRRLVSIDSDKARFRVHRDAFRSPEVFAAEKELIFSRCWLYLGHASEIAQPGQFVTRSVGGRDLIFSRARNGQPMAFHNSCTHRGAQVCREARGSARTFSCPYHGWVFNTEGRLMSMNATSGFPDDINSGGDLNLAPVARLEDYRGLFFVNYDPNAISLSDYLASAKDMLDLMMDQAEGGEIEVLPGEHAYTVRANYKSMCENSYDTYHVPVTHLSYLEYLQERDAGADSQSVVGSVLERYGSTGGGRGLGHGHACTESWLPTGRPVAQWVPSWGTEVKEIIDATRIRLNDRFGTERADRIAESSKNLILFPNLVINDNVGFTVRTIDPIAHDCMNIRAWALAPVGESPKLRELRLDNFVSFLGPAGMGSADDVEMMEMCQRGAEHSPLEWNEVSKGMNGPDDHRREVCGPDDEGQLRAYWTQWDLMMRGEKAFEEE